jgi:hypothetical protein
MDITYSRIPASQASGGFFTFAIRLTRFLIFLFPDGAKEFYPLEPALSKVHSPSANAFNGNTLWFFDKVACRRKAWYRLTDKNCEKRTAADGG